jgi:hypothetical protein
MTSTASVELTVGNVDRGTLVSGVHPLVVDGVTASDDAPSVWVADDAGRGRRPVRGDLETHHLRRVGGTRERGCGLADVFLRTLIRAPTATGEQCRRERKPTHRVSHEVSLVHRKLPFRCSHSTAPVQTGGRKARTAVRGISR